MLVQAFTSYITCVSSQIKALTSFKYALNSLFHLTFDLKLLNINHGLCLHEQLKEVKSVQIVIANFLLSIAHCKYNI